MCSFSLDIAWLISSFHDDFAPSTTSGYYNNPSWLAAQEIRSRKFNQRKMYGNMSNTRLGTTNKSGLFAAKLFESYSVGIVNLGLFSLEGTLHQIPNALRRLLAFMNDPVHLFDNGHFNA